MPRRYLLPVPGRKPASHGRLRQRRDQDVRTRHRRGEDVTDVTRRGPLGPLSLTPSTTGSNVRSMAPSRISGSIRCISGTRPPRLACSRPPRAYGMSHWLASE